MTQSGSNNCNNRAKKDVMTQQQYHPLSLQCYYVRLGWSVTGKCWFFSSVTTLVVQTFSHHSPQLVFRKKVVTICNNDGPVSLSWASRVHATRTLTLGHLNETYPWLILLVTPCVWQAKISTMSKGCQTAGYRKPSRVTFRGIRVLICVLMGCFQHTTTRYLGCLIYTRMKWGKTRGSFKFAWYLVLMEFFLAALAADSSSNHNTNGYFSQ